MTSALKAPEPIEATAASRQSWHAAISDLSEGISLWRLWTAFGYEDLRQAYRRTMLGLAWIAIAFGSFALVKIVVFSGFNDASAQWFTTWLVAGFLTWQFISHVIITGAGVFIASEGWIKGVKLPLSVHVFQSIWRLALQDGINLVVAYALIIAFGVYSAPGLLLGLLAIPLYLLTAVPVQLLLGLLCAHSRDLQQLIGTVMRLLFFATPIIWVPKEGTVLATISFWNPFSYFIALFRTPVLDGNLPLDSVGVWFTFTLLLWIAALFAFKNFRGQLAYWL